MNDSDQSSAAALGPHRQNGDHTTPATGSGPGKPAKSPWFVRLYDAWTNRGGSSIRADLTEALEGLGATFPESFSANERALLQNVLKLRDIRVDDVMVPRADIEAADAGDTMGELILAFLSAGHSRLPVFEENLDQIVGFVHIKDALQRISAEAPVTKDGRRSGPPVKLQSTALRQKISGRDMVRQVLFVPPSMPVGDLLQKMQATRVHMAIVVDEYGGTDGLVTIEDLLEAVVGDIEDEHDEDDGPLVRKVDENNFVADGRVELEELQAALGDDFDPGKHQEDVDTLGGLLFNLVGRVPVRGEVISRIKGFEFEILSADARRIRQVHIMRRKRPPRPRPTPISGGNTPEGRNQAAE